MKMKKKQFALFALIGVLLLSGCGASEASKNAMAGAAYDMADMAAESYAYEEEMAYDTADVAREDNTAEQVEESAQGTNRKLIRTVSMNVETENYDALLPNIEKKVQEYGGYIESSSTYNNTNPYGNNDGREANMTVRIPAQNLDAFLHTVSDQSNVTYKSENVQDVTLSYVDLQSHKKALEEEQKRLMDFMEEAETIEELITIEDRLTQVRYELESMESQIRTYDNQVDYSTVSINILEVKQYTPVEEESAWTRISKGFAERTEAVLEGLENFGIWFVIHIPDLIVIAVVIFIILLIIWLCVRGSKKRAAKRGKMQPPAANAPVQQGKPQPTPAVPQPATAAPQTQTQTEQVQKSADAGDQSGKDTGSETQPK
ncbi:MAG: DUF4349 domain-containing protein [Lachnospiraceae bacterium]|nr:DUF4349 domain-containing protein [Lachnospiraceae bacterium]